MWRIKVKHPNGVTKIYSSFNADSLVKEFRRTLIEDFALKIVSENDLALTIGHPPQQVKNDGTMQEAGITDASLVSISLSAAQAAPRRKPALASKGKKKKQSESDSSDVEELHLEDDNDDEKSKRRGSGNTPRKSAKQPASTPNRIHTIHDKSRLVQPRKKIRSKEELEQVLAQSAARGEPKDAVARFFRKLTRGEVVKQYEISAANAKYMAVLSKKYEITPATTASAYRLGDGAPMEVVLKIKYKKGPRSFGTETVQGLNEDLLKETIRSVLHTQGAPDDALSHPREGLRPHALPLISPRVFWSLIHLKGGGADCIENALRSLLPEENWAFLQSRTRNETERAREWRRTENILDVLERNIDPSAAVASDDHNGSGMDEVVEEENIVLRDVVDADEDVDKLSRRGISTLLQLADAQSNSEIREEWIGDAQAIVASQLTDEILVDCDEVVKEKLFNLDIKTPSDIARLRIPGRTEMVQEETGLNRDVIERWKAKAAELILAHSWLDAIRTRG